MKHLKELGCGLALAALVGISCILSGCGVFENGSSSGSSSDSSSAVVSSIFDAALTAASNILASDGTQALAVAAAEAYVAQNVSDPTQQQAYNQLIETAVPTLADSLAASLQNASTTTTTTDAKALRKAKLAKVRVVFVKSPEFKKIVSDCVSKYQAKSKKTGK